jgi:hypothetical protein
MSATALDDVAHLRESSPEERAKRDTANSRGKWRPEDFTETGELSDILKAEWEVRAVPLRMCAAHGACPTRCASPYVCRCL